MRTEFGWALKSDGWVVWKDTTQERHFERSAEVPKVGPGGMVQRPADLVGWTRLGGTHGILAGGGSTAEQRHSLVLLGHAMV